MPPTLLGLLCWLSSTKSLRIPVTSCSRVLLAAGRPLRDEAMLGRTQHWRYHIGIEDRVAAERLPNFCNSALSLIEDADGLQPVGEAKAFPEPLRRSPRIGAIKAWNSSRTHVGRHQRDKSS
jgi:hypothetical protein